jgi:hypothetical protein
VAPDEQHDGILRPQSEKRSDFPPSDLGEGIMAPVILILEVRYNANELVWVASSSLDVHQTIFIRVDPE